MEKNTRAKVLVSLYLTPLLRSQRPTLGPPEREESGLLLNNYDTISHLDFGAHTCEEEKTLHHL